MFTPHWYLNTFTQLNPTITCRSTYMYMNSNPVKISLSYRFTNVAVFLVKSEFLFSKKGTKIIHLKDSSALSLIRTVYISVDRKTCATLATVQHILSIEVFSNNISQWIKTSSVLGCCTWTDILLKQKKAYNDLSMFTCALVSDIST